MSPYDILGISPGASQQHIKKAYIEKVKQWHPDICKLPNATDMMQKINHAYESLTKTPPQVSIRQHQNTVVYYTAYGFGFSSGTTSAASGTITFGVYI